MTTHEEALALAIDRSIQVSGNKAFADSAFREAILYYLNGLWEERVEVESRPKIRFGDLTLRLHPASQRYYAYGRGRFEEAPVFGRHAVEYCGDRRAEVEQALARFAKSNRIQMLLIGIGQLTGGENRMVMLWKRPESAEYGCCDHGEPFPESAEEAYARLPR